MDQVSSFTSVATAPKYKMIGNTGILGIVVSEFLERNVAFDPIVQRRNTEITWRGHMWKFVLARIVLPSLFLLPAGTRLASAAPASALEGVWQVMKISGQRLAGVYIFAGSHYSMMAATTDRPEIDDARA